MSPTTKNNRDSADDTTLTNGDSVICHSLPCNIHYDGMAPVKSHFHPTVIDTISPLSDDETKSEEKDEKQIIMASQFRGRGLLSTYTTLPENVDGVLVQTCTSTNSTTKQQQQEEEETKGTMKVIATFDSMCEWHHEHEVDKVSSDVFVREGSALYRAEKWCELARAIHDPIL